MNSLNTIRKLQTRAGKLLRMATEPSFRAARRRRNSYDEFFDAIEQGTVVVRVPQFQGAFELDCRSHILKRLLVEREYETDVAQTMRQLVDSGRDAIDVGANVGFFTVLLSRLVSPQRVLAIEPTPGAFGHLRKNVKRNCGGNVLLYQGVATEREGEFILNTIEGMEEYSSLAKLVHPSVAQSDHSQTVVPGTTVDSLVEKWSLRPGFIKIDTEGAERQVLGGALQTIRECRPVILCEAWPDEWLAAAGAVPGEVEKLLRDCGYTVTSAHGEIIAAPAPR